MPTSLPANKDEFLHVGVSRKNELNNKDSCSICFETYRSPRKGKNGKNAVEIQQCGHIFGRDCLTKWLDQGKATCPMCRAVLFENSPPPMGVARTVPGYVGSDFYFSEGSVLLGDSRVRIDATPTISAQETRQNAFLYMSERLLSMARERLNSAPHIRPEPRARPQEVAEPVAVGGDLLSVIHRISQIRQNNRQDQQPGSYGNPISLDEENAADHESRSEPTVSNHRHRLGGNLSVLPLRGAQTLGRQMTVVGTPTPPTDGQAAQSESDLEPPMRRSMRRRASLWPRHNPSGRSRLPGLSDDNEDESLSDLELGQLTTVSGHRDRPTIIARQELRHTQHPTQSVQSPDSPYTIADQGRSAAPLSRRATQHLPQKVRPAAVENECSAQVQAAQAEQPVSRRTRKRTHKPTETETAAATEQLKRARSSSPPAPRNTRRRVQETLEGTRTTRHARR